MKRIIIQLADDVLEELDDAADEADVSRTALVREFVAAGLAERRRRQEIRRIVASFRKRPQEDDLVIERATVRKVWPD